MTALLQDHEGYLWIGTFGGLARLHGDASRVLDAGATPGFDNNNILSLYQMFFGSLVDRYCGWRCVPAGKRRCH